MAGAKLKLMHRTGARVCEAYALRAFASERAQAFLGRPPDGAESIVEVRALARCDTISRLRAWAMRLWRKLIIKLLFSAAQLRARADVQTVWESRLNESNSRANERRATIGIEDRRRVCCCDCGQRVLDSRARTSTSVIEGIVYVS